jgi:hypothetical protein
MTSFEVSELERLAEILAPMIAARLPPHVCPLSPEELAEARAMARLSMRAKSTAWATIIGAVVIGLFSLIFAGVGAWILGLFHRG